MRRLGLDYLYYYTICKLYAYQISIICLDIFKYKYI